MKYGKSVTFLFVGWGLLGGCVDTSPVAYTPEVRDAAADGAAGLACRQCITGDAAPCRSAYDVCVGTDRCQPVMDCILDANCMTFSLLPDRINCGLPCLDKFGVMAGTDPATTALGQINVCTFASCTTECSGR